MKEKRRFRKRLLQVLAGLAAAFVPAWWTGMFDGYLWGPEQVTLWLENVRRGESRPVEDHFRVVLCWLENDPDGKSTSNVAQAFTSVEGVGFAECGSWGDLKKLVNVLLMRHRVLRLSWPLLYHHTVTGALVLLPSPPRIAPSQLRLVGRYQVQVAP